MQSVTIDNRKKGAGKILLFLLSAMIIICETPYLSRNMNTTLVELLMVVFFVFYFLLQSVLKVDLAKTIAFAFVYVFIELLYKFADISTAGMGYYFATLKFLFIFIAMASLEPLLNQKQRYFLCTLSIVGMIVNMISNIIIRFSMNPTLYVVYYLYEGQNTNAADTAFSTAVMLLLGAFFLLVLHIKRGWLKICGIAGTVFCSYFLAFVSQRGTTFLLSIMMILLLLVFHVSSKKLATVLVVLSFISLWLALSGIAPLLTWISNAFNLERIGVKIGYLIRFFESGNIEEAGGSLTARFDLLMTSVKTFFESFGNFLVGVGDHRDHNSIVGNHSQFFDTFARYGLLGGSVFVWLLARMKVCMEKLSGAKKRTPLQRQLIVIFCFFLLRCLLGNTFIGSIGTQLFVTVPLLVSFLCSGDDEI